MQLSIPKPTTPDAEVIGEKGDGQDITKFSLTTNPKGMGCPTAFHECGDAHSHLRIDQVSKVDSTQKCM